MLPYCVDFYDEKATSIAISGGKGANIAILKQAGFDVPPGFILSTTAFTDFLTRNDLEQVIDRELSSVTGINSVQIQSISKKILNRLTESVIPGEVVYCCEKIHARKQ